MKAVVFHGIGDIRVDQVPDPVIEQPTDAIVRLTASAICGTDLHFIRGTFSGMTKGQVLGHEGVGIVEQVGPEVRNIRVGQRVIIPSTVGCGECRYCEEGGFAQCDRANPQGKRAGTVFYGGPEAAGGIKGLQAEKARCLYADTNLVPVPDEIGDDQAILLSDILPTGWFGADLAQVEAGETVAVFGCGPVGLMAIASAFVMGAGRVIAVDRLPDRLAIAEKLGAEPVNFDEVKLAKTLVEMTGGDGPDKVIEAVGVDAQHAQHGPDAPGVVGRVKEAVVQRLTEPLANAHGDHFVAGDKPAQSLDWAIECVRKSGTVAIIGVFPPTDREFPIGMAMNKNLTLRMGNCNHRRYYDVLIDHVRSGRLDPVKILSNVEPMTGAIEAYEAFDARQPGWIKVELEPAA
jgi:threonine dehydrogenase-like Zn-dependent dehydrogenase